MRRRGIAVQTMIFVALGVMVMAVSVGMIIKWQQGTDDIDTPETGLECKLQGGTCLNPPAEGGQPPSCEGTVLNSDCGDNSVCCVEDR